MLKLTKQMLKKQLLLKKLQLKSLGKFQGEMLEKVNDEHSSNKMYKYLELVYRYKTF
jgi:hypothetical protein